MLPPSADDSRTASDAAHQAHIPRIARTANECYNTGMDRKLEQLAGIMEEVAGGVYSDRIMAFTGTDQPEHVRRLAEAMGMMMVKLEAREQHRDELISQLQHANALLQCATVDTVVAIANALYARDPYTAGHGQRVALYAERLAKRCGISGEERERLRLAAELHDIGKIGFSDRVFSNEDATVTPGMRAEIARHPNIAMDILGHLECLGEALDFINLHHERLDGSGYPHGKRANEIPRGARIVAIADCFDAMTTDRPYRKGLSAEQAIPEIVRCKGTQFDPELVDVFISLNMKADRDQAR